MRKPARSAHLLIVVLACVLAAPALAQKGRTRSKRVRRTPVEIRTQPPPEASRATTPQATEGGGRPSRGPTRIDFDDRLIQGQTNKSGAVYLYDRKELKQRSMVRVRESFREETIRTVYDR